MSHKKTSLSYHGSVFFLINLIQQKNHTKTCYGDEWDNVKLPWEIEGI